MIKKLYIHNYKSFTNFELEFDSINLLMGENGTGKSTIFEVINKLQRYIVGEESLSNLFNVNTLSRWHNSGDQEFELEIHNGEDIYRYKLTLQYDESSRKAVRLSEKLWLNDLALIQIENGTFTSNVATGENGPLVVNDFSIDLSIIQFTPDTKLSQPVTWFRKRIRRIIVIQISPNLVEHTLQSESCSLDYNARNFAAWYHFISQDQGKAIAINKVLADAVDGFDYFQFLGADKQPRTLSIRFTENDNFVSYLFNELSDGQKALIILYTLLHYTESQDYTICLDEPDNFVALPEIQPWLVQLDDLCDDDKLQALLISHHPECVNYLVATDSTLWFSRSGAASPTRVRSIAKNDFSSNGIAVSELFARGWIDG